MLGSYIYIYMYTYIPQTKASAWKGFLLVFKCFLNSDSTSNAQNQCCPAAGLPSACRGPAAGLPREVSRAVCRAVCRLKSRTSTLLLSTGCGDRAWYLRHSQLECVLLTFAPVKINDFELNFHKTMCIPCTFSSILLKHCVCHALFHQKYSKSSK